MRSGIPIAMNHEGLRLEGKVVYLRPGEIRVLITSPLSGVSASRQLFAREPGEQAFEREGLITAEGKRAAARLLTAIYKKQIYFIDNREALIKEYQPVRDRLQAAYEELRSTLPDYNKDNNDDVLVRHQMALQNIFILHQEFFETITRRHMELENMGMDTFMDLMNNYLLADSLP